MESVSTDFNATVLTLSNETHLKYLQEIENYKDPPNRFSKEANGTSRNEKYHH